MESVLRRKCCKVLEACCNRCRYNLPMGWEIAGRSEICPYPVYCEVQF